ncbi:hypothetical protein ACI2KR_07210 [Pseudomonas luteola]
MVKFVGKAVGAFQQAKLMSVMVAESNTIMKTYPKDKVELALKSDDGITKLAEEIYPKLSESIRASVPKDRFIQVLVATRKGFLKKKKNKKILQEQEL